MTFNEESLRKGIRSGLGSQGIWTPELENKMFEEIKNQALSQDSVMKSVCCCVNWHLPIKADEGKKAVCSYCKRPRHTVS